MRPNDLVLSNALTHGSEKEKHCERKGTPWISPGAVIASGGSRHSHPTGVGTLGYWCIRFDDKVARIHLRMGTIPAFDPSSTDYGVDPEVRLGSANAPAQRLRLYQRRTIHQLRTDERLL